MEHGFSIPDKHGAHSLAVSCPIARLPEAGAQATPRRIARLARNAVANLLRLGASWIILLIVPPILVRCLTHPEYATWMLVLQLTAYTTLFDGALQMSVSRFVARATFDHDFALLAETLSSITLLFVVAACLVLAAMAALALLMPHFFHAIPAALMQEARASLLIVGGALAIAFPASALAGLTLGMEQNHINAIAGGLSKLFAATGAIWAALHHQGLVRMALWTAVGILAQPVVYVIVIAHRRLWPLFSPALLRARRAWEFIRFCSASLASQLSLLFISGLDLPIVAAFDFKHAGFYAVAITAGNMAVVPYGAVLSTLVPMISSKTAAESPQRMGEILLRTTRLSTALLAWFTLPLMIGMPVLLRLWVGADYAAHTLVIGELLAAALLVRFTVHPYGLIGFTAGEQNRMLVSPAVESAVNLLLSLLLVRHLGAVGVAIGTLIGAFVGVALHFWNSMPRTRSMEFSRSKLLVNGILIPIGWALLVALPGAWILHNMTAIYGELLLLAAFAIALAIVFWKMVLHSEDRRLIHQAAGHFIPAFSHAQGQS